MRGLDGLDVTLGSLHLVDPLVAREPVLLGGREVVGDRKPDRTGELEQLRVERAERTQRVEIAGPGVVLVEDPRRTVVEHDRGVAQRPVGRRGHRENRHAETVEIEAFRVLGAHELGEAERPELTLQQFDTELGQQDPRLPAHVAREPLRIEVVAMQVRDVEVVGRGERRRVERVVSGEREPRAEVRGREPRVAQHRAGTGLHEPTGVTEEGDAHVRPFSRFASRVNGSGE